MSVSVSVSVSVSMSVFVYMCNVYVCKFKGVEMDVTVWEWALLCVNTPFKCSRTKACHSFK